MEKLVQHVRTLLDRFTGGGGVWPLGLTVGGVPRGARGVLLAALAQQTPEHGTLLVILPGEEEVDALEGDLAAALAPAELATGRLPGWERGTPDQLSSPAALEVLCERLLLLRQLQEQTVPALVLTHLEALLQPVLHPASLERSCRRLAVGERLEVERFTRDLLAGGLIRRARAETPGEFAVRGGLIDLFPFAEEHPLRIELFGDQIESIRRFQVESQRSVANLQEVLLVVAPPDLLMGEDHLTGFLRAAQPASLSVWVEPRALRERALRLAARTPDAPELLTRLEREEQATSLRVTHLAPPPGDRSLHLQARTTLRFTGEPGETFARLREETRCGERVLVLCRSPAEVSRFQELAAGEGEGPEGAVEIRAGLQSEGFQLPDLRTTVLSADAILGRTLPPPRRQRRFYASRPLESYLTLRTGDHVVHLSHGIGRFAGLETVEKEGRAVEHLVLEFAEQTRLLVPAANADLVHRYIGTGDDPPALSRLGSSRWGQKRSRVAREVMDLAADLLRLQALRERHGGLDHPPRSRWQMEFEAAFPYVETPDQVTVMEDIHADLERPRAMDRLLCGDVGYGKTELAMRAAFRAVEGGYQVAVLVPTTVLAAQHHRTFTDRMAPYPVRVEALSRFQTSAQQQRILEDLRRGTVDILVGTHRLLSRDVEFNNLGLVVVDEEQRFGVEHKERLKRMRPHVEVLTMTATPIPRTLHMAMMGIRDISSLTTPPRERMPVETHVVELEPRLVREAILAEMARDGQVFYVHNRVHDIQEVAFWLMELVPEARVGIGHGQMSERVLERTMRMFIDGRLDVLLCTTIIESGLDIPNANTILIDRADTFGLSDLHQLRGRVGRYNRKACCYLLVHPDRALSEVGLKRLQAIDEYSELGSGFNIALRDLEIRGSGNILGREQSGHIAAVGYEFYCRLLRAAANQLQGQEAATSLPAEIPVDLGVDTSIPEDYVPDPEERLILYTRLAGVGSLQEEERVREELRDRFGPLPVAVEALLTIGLAKPLLQALGVKALTADPDEHRHRLILKTAPHQAQAVEASLDQAAGFVRHINERTVMVDLRPPPDTPGAVLAGVRLLMGLSGTPSSSGAR